MRWMIILLVVMIWVQASSALRFVRPVASTNQLLVTIVPQLDSPLKIEDAVGYQTRLGQAAISYRVRNVADKRR